LLAASLRFQTTIQEETLGLSLARKTLDEVRAWARVPANYDSASWSVYNTTMAADPDYPGFSTVVNVEAPGALPLFSPCTAFESALPVPQQRVMPTARAVIQVVVTWSDPVGRNVTLVTQVGRPAGGPLTNVTVSRSAGPADPVPENDIVNFVAQPTDAGGNLMPDVLCEWWVVSEGGSASITTTNGPLDSSDVNVTNGVPVGVFIEYSAGPCTVFALARVQGISQQGFGNVVTAP
jgi:hypothetical protein